MSFDSEHAAARQPRSLTLTFAETHPWERLVRDRLNALPRGYLKRFVLLLIEKAELDLSSDEAFARQVEQALLQRELPLGRSVVKKAVAVDQVSIEAQPTRETVPAPSRMPAPQAPRRPEPAAPAAHRGSDPGFGALEL